MNGVRVEVVSLDLPEGAQQIIGFRLISNCVSIFGGKLMKKIAIVLTAILILLFFTKRRIDSITNLDDKRKKSYSTAVKFSNENQKWGDFELNEIGFIRVENGRDYFDDDSLVVECCSSEARIFFGKKNISDLREIFGEMKYSSTHYIRREGDILLFYPEGKYPLNDFGFIFSTKSRNPNLSGGENVSMSRPFTPLGGGWYSTKHLFYKGLGTSPRK